MHKEHDRPKNEGAEVAGRNPDKPQGLPSAGPHAKPELTNEDATPGTGMLPPVGECDDPNAQPSG